MGLKNDISGEAGWWNSVWGFLKYTFNYVKNNVNTGRSDKAFKKKFNDRYMGYQLN